MEVLLVEEKLNSLQLARALSLNEGPVLIAYRSRGSLYMETCNGKQSYVWRANNWHRQKVVVSK